MPYCQKQLRFPPGQKCGAELDEYGTCPNVKNHKSGGNTNKSKGYGKQNDTEEAHGKQAKGSWSRSTTHR